MKDSKVFLVAGGDKRQQYTADKLAEKHRVYITGFKEYSGKAIFAENISDIKEKADCLVLPLPFSTDNIYLNTPYSEKKISLSSLKTTLKEDTYIVGGRINETAEQIFGNVHDYTKREDFAILNAIPTAEAGIEIAMKQIEKTLYKSHILITGGGRIAKALVKILKGFGAEIIISARKKTDLLWAEIFGIKAIEITELENTVSESDIIFNTVPARLLNSRIIDRLKPTAIIIDLASAPGGTDFEYAEKRNIRASLSLSLPGKHSPVTAGEIIAQTILNMIEERRYPT